MRGVGGGKELGAMVCVRGGRDGNRVFEEERRKRVHWGKEEVEMGAILLGRRGSLWILELVDLSAGFGGGGLG